MAETESGFSKELTALTALQLKLSRMWISHVTYFQGIEEDEISFARDLFPKTQQHGMAIGIRQKDDPDLGEVDGKEGEEEDKVMRQEMERKVQEREYEEEETSARESELSSASDSVSLEVDTQHLEHKTLMPNNFQVPSTGRNERPSYLPSS